MEIEVNRDIDKFEETVVLGLTARQLLFSVIAVAIGAGVIFLIYRSVGLTLSAYIAVPIVAPIALTGFYNYHGMTFMQMLKLRMHFMFFAPTYTYVSTEDESELASARREIALEAKDRDKMTFSERLIARKMKKNERTDI